MHLVDVHKTRPLYRLAISQEIQRKCQSPEPPFCITIFPALCYLTKGKKEMRGKLLLYFCNFWIEGTLCFNKCKKDYKRCLYNVLFQVAGYMHTQRKLVNPMMLSTQCYQPCYNKKPQGSLNLAPRPLKCIFETSKWQKFDNSYTRRHLKTKIKSITLYLYKLRLDRLQPPLRCAPPKIKKKSLLQKSAVINTTRRSCNQINNSFEIRKQCPPFKVPCTCPPKPARFIWWHYFATHCSVDKRNILHEHRCAKLRLWIN